MVGLVRHIAGGERVTSNESDDVRFFMPVELPATTFPEHVHRVRDAMCMEPQTMLKRAEEPSPRGRGNLAAH